MAVSVEKPKSIGSPNPMQRLRRKFVRERIPVSGSFELTHRCNLRCIHCYLGNQQEIRGHRRNELSTEEVFRILDELVDAGTLNLTLTGGDPMVRKDFPEIYAYAARKGFLLTVLCDGILVTESLVGLFRRYPPQVMDISVYGATGETYERVTQVPGSFRRFKAGIERLNANGIRFQLKTVLLQTNKHELDTIEAMADGYGVDFRYDSAIFPCLPYDDNAGRANKQQPTEVAVPIIRDLNEHLSNGGARTPGTAGSGPLSPLALRVPAEEVAEIDFATERRAERWWKTHLHEKDKPGGTKLYRCGAALTGFHIDPYGYLQPCLMTTGVRYSLREGSFMDGWNGPMAALREIDAGDHVPCNACDRRSVCSGCPSMFELETGAPDLRSSYVCRSTHLRFEKLLKHNIDGS